MLFLNATFETGKKPKHFPYNSHITFHKSALQLKSLPCMECIDKKPHRKRGPVEFSQGQGLLPGGLTFPVRSTWTCLCALGSHTCEWGSGVPSSFTSETQLPSNPDSVGQGTLLKIYLVSSSCFLKSSHLYLSL